MGRCSYSAIVAAIAVVLTAQSAVAQKVQWEADSASAFSADHSDAPEFAQAENPSVDDGDAQYGSRERPSDDEGRFLLHNTAFGNTGGVHVVDARAAPHRTFRLALTTGFFVLNDFIVDDDEARYFSGALSFSWTPYPNLEVFAALNSLASHNNAGNPTLIQQLSDIHGGLKLFKQVKPFLALGGDASFSIPGSVGDAGVGFKGTSAGLRGNLTADFRYLRKRVPLIARFNAQYWLNNTDNLIQSTEDARYARLSNQAPRDLETRHLLSGVERFGLNINRTDFVNIGVGLEAPLRVGKRFRIHPLAEWTLGLPINRQGYSCSFVGDPANVSKPLPGADSCLNEEGFKAFPMNVTVGARFYPPVRGLGLLVAADIGLTGTKHFTHELAPNVPYKVIIGVSYAYEPRTYRANETEAPDTEIDSLPELIDTGLLEPNFDEIEPVPPAEPVAPVRPKASLEITTVDEEGISVGEVGISVTGPENQDFTTNGNGLYKLDTITDGKYMLSASALGYYPLSQPLEVQEGKSVIATVRLVKRAKKSRVTIGKRRVAIRGQIMFQPGKDTIAVRSERLLYDLVETLTSHSELELVEVQGHTDNRGGQRSNMDLSQRRAEAVVDWLTRNGISLNRLTARGYGDSRPVIPNITAKNRARNRRAEFIIHRRSDVAQ